MREISLCARPSPDKPGLPGHAFVAFAQTQRSGERTFRAIGHTVFSAGGALVSFGGLIPTTGALVDEKYTAIKQECLTLQVNKSDYEAAYVAATQPLSRIGVKFDESKPIQQTYALAAADCMTFVITIAQRFTAKGVTIPARAATDLPLPYMRKVIDAN
jgi:hypothetical protein